MIGLDASTSQVQRAEACPGVVFRVGTAEATGLPSASVDLLTAAQVSEQSGVP